MKLTGKTAYVTGAGNGIGRAVALKLASEGANVVVNDLKDSDAQAVVDEITAAGGSAIALAGSVTEDGFAERFIGACEQRRLHMGRTNRPHDRRYV